MSPHKLSEEAYRRLQEGFELLGIQPNEYPDYIDPVTFSTSFSICTAYKQANTQSDSCSLCGEKINAQLERSSS